MHYSFFFSTIGTSPSPSPSPSPTSAPASGWNPADSDSLFGWLSSIAEGFGTLAGDIASSIGNLFIPSDGYFDSKIQPIKEKFGFVDIFIGYVNGLSENFQTLTGEAPDLHVDLTQAESEYNWGESALAINLDWYERYKPTGDQVIIVFSYAFFIWRVFRKLPDIIGGSGAIVDNNKEDIEKWWAKNHHDN